MNKQSNAALTDERKPPERLLKKEAYELFELTELGHGSRAYLYAEIGAGRLRARKRGRRTVILRPDLEEWVRNLPAAKIAAPKSNSTAA